MPDKKPLEISFVSSDSFREIFQTSAEGIIMINDTGKILLANPVSEKMFGYMPDTLVGTNLEDLLPERYRSRHLGFRKQFNEHPAPRRMGVGRDLQAMRQDGSEFPIEISLSYTTISDQMLSMAFITDITERKGAESALKKSEEQLIEYAAQLEKKVESRTEALNLLVEKLENANRELQQQIIVRKKAEEEPKKSLEKERELNELKSRFVSTASHEFRTPLSAILSSTSLIKQYHDRKEPDKIDKHIERVKSSVNHLTIILNDFLSLSKLEEGRIEVNISNVEVSSFMDEIEEEIKPILKSNQQFTVDLTHSNKELNTDPKLLRGILFNLISNASKYSGSGGHISLGLSSNDKHTVIVCKDDGIGIPQSDVKYVFDRFFRASNAANIQGTGLGLNIVRRYIDLLGGTIAFQSVENKGSIFTITLPLKDV
ncbi:hypothetical protein BH10BAC4_BH10BAC4_09680 [soil metagenome]